MAKATRSTIPDPASETADHLEIGPLDDDACQRALAILVDVGTSIALELKAATPDVGLAARAAAFDRVALAVRRTVLLSRHMAESAPAREAEPAKRALTAQKIIRAVQDEIEKTAGPAETVALRLELLERVEAPEFRVDLALRAPGELIRDLCRDLGLADVPGLRTFPRRTPDEIARLCAQAAAITDPARPVATGRPPPRPDHRRRH